jgi:hypothetical protein
MFRSLLPFVTPAGPPDVNTANAILAVHPMQLSRWLDEVWAAGGLADSTFWQQVLAPNTKVPLGDISKSKIPPGLLATLRSGVAPTRSAGGPAPTQTWSGNPGVDLMPPPVWDHMLYAYLIEATGIFEIMGDVVRRYVVGESLPLPGADTVAWVRSTEDLFYRDPPLFSSGGALVSQLRPDAAVNRRNGYWRMFGMDLPHPVGRGVQGQPWKRDVGPTVNSRFLELWNELLRQVWLGYENDTNSSGSKPTDPSYVGYLCQTLSELLQLRRQGGMLAREEFAVTSMMSWFHLTVEYDTAVVSDLKAMAGPGGNPADRLAAIGARVGIAPSRQSRELFELADLISPLLWCIELGLFTSSTNAELLYRRNGIPNPVIAQNMNRIIDLWQSGTGERVKDLAVTTRRAGLDTRQAQPTRMLPGPLVPTATAPANGHRSVSPTRP